MKIEGSEDLSKTTEILSIRFDKDPWNLEALALSRTHEGPAGPHSLTDSGRPRHVPIGTLVSYFTRERLKLVRKRLMLCSFASTRRQNRL
jgi:hypothetical protein